MKWGKQVCLGKRTSILVSNEEVCQMFSSDHLLYVLQNCQVSENSIYHFHFCWKKCAAVYIFLCFVNFSWNNQAPRRFEKSSYNREGLIVLSEIGFKGVSVKVNMSNKEKMLQYVLFDSFCHKKYFIKSTFHVLVCDFLIGLDYYL